MLEHLYDTLTAVGYSHPIHPPMTHATVGMVIGAFVFGIVAWVFRNPALTRTARHCIILALVALIPTVILGYADWQHYYAGGWLFPIKMKLPLAALLVVFLVLALVKSRKVETVSAGILFLYLLCLLNVAALGYFGGEIVYGKAGTGGPPESNQSSAEQFNKSCNSCHPKGGNTIKANLPLQNAPQLSDFETFLAYVRNPKARDGSPTIMPPFATDKLTQKQVQEIYRYITQVLAKN